MSIQIYNDSCLEPDKRIPDCSVELGIFDPPFGIKEVGFDKYYKRNSSNVIPGYDEAPEEYSKWTLAWMVQAQRVLKENGSIYVFMGHSNLRFLLNVAAELGFREINHLIWKYNFGVYTKKKFVTSHYHLLHYAKTAKSKTTFNLNCRFGSQEKDGNGGSLLYQDMEDVFFIPRDYSPDKKKNQNKLPEALIQKLILYSSNPGDTVCDFFMGNFTTAYAALKLGRKVCGYESNQHTFKHHMPILEKLEFGSGLSTMKNVVNIVPENQGKKISAEESAQILADYSRMLAENVKKGEISLFLQEKYKRGRFSIKNILDKLAEKAA